MFTSPFPYLFYKFVLCTKNGIVKQGWLNVLWIDWHHCFFPFKPEREIIDVHNQFISFYTLPNLFNLYLCKQCKLNS